MPAKMDDLATMIMLGIDPKTKKPSRTNPESRLSEGIRRQLAIIDIQDAINRYHWIDLPNGLTGQLIEGILYHRGRGAIFYSNISEQFYFLPFTLQSSDGSGLDVYGRPVNIKAMPYRGTSDSDDSRNIFDNKSYKAIYDVIPYDDWNPDIMDNCAVTLNDYNGIYTPTTFVPRIHLQGPLLDIMSKIIPYMRTSLAAASGVTGMRVSDQSEYSNVIAMNGSIDQAALNANRYVPVVGQIDFQELTTGSVANAEEYLLALQALDNYRLSLYGLDNGGLFQKKAHVLQSEEEINSRTTGLIMQDGLSLRQHFCNVVNSVWGIGIWCEPSENASETDYDQNGIIEDNIEESEKIGEEGDNDA